jgi:dienelactone hydrolase
MLQQAIEVERDGSIIRGTVYRPSAAGRVPTVLLLHGFTGQRIEAGFFFVQLGRTLAQRGIAAVTFDFLHSGESDGSFSQMLVSGQIKDALRMSAWLLGQPFADRSRLGLLGFSLGGLVASCVVGELGQYKALVLLAPTTASNLCRVAGEAPDGAPVTVGPHTLHPEFFRDLKTLNPVAQSALHPRATLLVQGEADTAVTPAVSQAYVDAMTRAGVPLTVERVAEADHAFGKPPHRQAVLSTVSQWLGRAL